MGNFNQGGRGGGFGGSRGGFGGRDGGRSSGGFGGGRSGGFRGGSRGGDREVTMHQATCDQCKKSCEVPFLPTNTKPVYCKECFDLRGGKPASESRGGGFGARRDDRGGRPSFTPNNGGGEMKNQLEGISAKLDKLIKLLEKPVTTHVVESKPVEKVKAEKTAPVAKVVKDKKVAKKKTTKK